MAAVDHDSWNSLNWIVVFFAKWAFIFVQKFVDELIDFFAEEVGRIFSLFEEKSGWVL